MNLAYFKDGHQEEILTYYSVESCSGDRTVIFYTPNDKYLYQSYLIGYDFAGTSNDLMLCREHVFSRYDSTIDNWLRVDIERIEIHESL